MVIEVDRPNRQKRRRHGKSDQLDAVEAARGALSGRCEADAKSGDASRRSVAGVAGRETIGAFDTDPHDRPAPPSDVHRPRRAARQIGRVDRNTAGQRGRQASPTTRW